MPIPSTRRHAQRRTSLPLAAALLLAGCGGGDDPPAASSAGTAPEPQLSTQRYARSGTAACDAAFFQNALSALTGNLATKVTAAEVFEEGTPGGGPASASNPLLPRHCIVTGTINEHTGAPNATLYGNRFRLRLPESWNGRFLFTGGGGNNGTVGTALGDLRDGSRALAQGFAVVAQDSGHAGSSPTFALDEEAYKDFAHESVHDASQVSRQLLQSYFGMQPRHSYFVGCSNGGREAMVTAQRYADFDGVVAGAPAMNIFDQWMQDAWSLRAVAEIVGTPPGTMPTSTSEAFSDAQLAAITGHFVRKCDPLDGATDGIVSNHQACQATPQDLLALQCASQGGLSTEASCLTSAQVTGLRKLYDGPRNSAGVPLFTGINPGGVELNWRSGLLGSGAGGLGSWYASTIPNLYYFGYGPLGYPGAAADPKNPALYPTAPAYVASFNFDLEPQKMSAGRLQMHGDNVDPSAPGPNFEAFRQRKGRMLLYVGSADASVKTPGVVSFIDRLGAQYTPAGAADMARLFVVPGMGHCRGGKSTDSFDELTPLMKWVELGIAPERITAKANATLDPANVGISRPLCAHPKYAKYKGEGDVNRAESYVCAE